MSIEELEELLVPLFETVQQCSYDPSTAIAYMNLETIPPMSYHDSIDYMRVMLNELLHEVVIVDAGGIYDTSARKHLYGWWIQFKL